MRADQAASADYIILLGGDPTRVQRACEAFNKGVSKHLLITGRGDAWTNREVLIREGVPDEAIEVEDTSASTIENARFCAPILRRAKAKKAAIVTSWYHSARAYATFHHEIPEIQFISLPEGRNPQRAQYERSIARLEVLKRIGYFVRYGVPLH